LCHLLHSQDEGGAEVDVDDGDVVGEASRAPDVAVRAGVDLMNRFGPEFKDKFSSGSNVSLKVCLWQFRATESDKFIEISQVHFLCFLSP
jgi:hypothetical protein